MSSIDYETARKKFDEGFDCYPELNDTGREAIKDFVTQEFSNTTSNMDDFFNQVQNAGMSLIVPCASPLMNLQYQNNGQTLTKTFRMLPKYFDWYER